MRRVPLYAKDGSVKAWARVDDADVEVIANYVWRLHSRGYAVANAGTVLMHRVIMGEPEGLLVDHRNHDKLDNQRRNLRVVTYSQNGQNRSGASAKNQSSRHRGVGRARRGRWRARVIVGGRERTTHHATEAEAARGVRELRALHMTHTNEQRS